MAYDFDTLEIGDSGEEAGRMYKQRAINRQKEEIGGKKCLRASCLLRALFAHTSREFRRAGAPRAGRPQSGARAASSTRRRRRPQPRSRSRAPSSSSGCPPRERSPRRPAPRATRARPTRPPR
eukprot:7333-Pleurochrysis_carterae.AAC.1